MDLDQGKSDAHQIALELMKQIITLASGVVALSATFLDKLPTGTLSLVLLASSWAALVVSIFFGLETIVKSRLDPEQYHWHKGSGQTYARISKYAFVSGILLFAAFAFLLFVWPNVWSPIPAIRNPWPIAQYS